MRAAIIHVAADAAVSIFVIVGLVLARTFGWLWMDPVAGIAGGMVITDFHLWRIGPGHLAAIISVVACEPRSPGYYRSRLAHITALSHLTVEITRAV